MVRGLGLGARKPRGTAGGLRVRVGIVGDMFMVVVVQPVTVEVAHNYSNMGFVPV
jgi:hypothetical protein